MTISDIIKRLEEIKKEQGDIQVGCDFRYYDDDLYYDRELVCVFGE